MPSHDARRASAERAVDPKSPAESSPSGSPGLRLSRRSLLQGAATAGAAGLAATALGAAAASPALAATGRPSAARGPQRGAGAPGSSGPIVVHVRNAKSGDIEVFSGTSQNRLRDKDLANRIARAIG
jgi:nitrous oxide reductase